jgi:hypothetical protein
VSATALPLGAGAATARPALPLPLLAACGWVVVALALAPLSTDAFVWWSGLGFAAALAWPFARAGRRLDPGDATWCFLLYLALAMLLRGVGLLTFVDSPYLRLLGDARSPGFRALVGWTFFYTGLGVCAFSAARHARAPRRGLEALLLRARWAVAPWRSSRVLGVGVALLAVGGLGALLRVHSLGGFASAAADPLRAGSEDAVGRFWMIALTECAVVGFHVLVIGAMLRRGPYLALWLGLGLGLAVPLFAISGSKALLIRLLFTPMLFRHFLVKPLRLRHVLAFFGVFALLFPLFYAYRALGIAGLDGVRLYLETTETPLLKLYNRAYDADSFARVLHATGQGLVPLQWGRSLLDLLVFWVPRALWAAKPASFGLTFPALCMPDVEWAGTTYVSSSLPGELFLDFHVAGVVLGFLALGWALRAGHHLVRRGGPGAVLLYGYVFLAAVHLVEGGIAAQLEFLLMSAVPAMLALPFLLARRAPAGGRPA